MRVENLLNFLNNTIKLDTLEFATCPTNLVNFLDLMLEEEQFTQKIDLGLIYIYQKSLNDYTLVDGLSRFLSLSLLLHAVCECYKKTTPKNANAIKTIRAKYLFNNEKTKLRLPKAEQVIYEKILNGDRLSGKEKEHPMFVLLHNFWSKIKEEEIHASNIFKMLQKIVITVVECENVSMLDLYCTLNNDSVKLNHIVLISYYLKSFDLQKEWEKAIKCFNNKRDFLLFLNDFFVTKFNFKQFEEKRLYTWFTNYFETMLKFHSPEALMAIFLKSAQIYRNILYVNFDNNDIKNKFIQIKIHNGEDTYAYLLNIFEDYYDNNISEATLLEILSTIDDYLKNRQKTQNNVAFNELIEYLNAFITCK